MQAADPPRPGALDRAETLRQLEPEGVTVEILRTHEAVATYNRPAEREPVGALIHCKMVKNLWQVSWQREP